MRMPWQYASRDPRTDAISLISAKWSKNASHDPGTDAKP